MIKRISEKIIIITRNSFGLSVLFSLILLLNTTNSVYASATPNNDSYDRTPIQILDVSKSSFDILPGQSDYLVLTLVNLNEIDEKVKIEISDFAGFNGNKLTDNEANNNIEFVFDDMFWIPKDSIVRIPIDFSIDSRTKLTFIQSAIKIMSVSEDASLDLAVIQPIKIRIKNDTAYVPISSGQTKHPVLRIFILLLLISVITLLFKFKKILGNKRLFVLLIIFSSYPIWMAAKTNNPLSYFALDIKTDIFKEFKDENKNMGKDLELEEDPTSPLFKDYEFKSAETGGYIELYGTVIDEEQDTTFFYEKPLTLTKNIDLTNDNSLSSEDVDIKSASESIDIDIKSASESVDMDEVSQNQQMSDMGTLTTDYQDIDIETPIDEPEYTTLDIISIKGSEIIYNDKYGVQVSIKRSSHTEYKGLEMEALALLMSQNIKRDLVRKYVAKALTMSDGGDIRIGVLKACDIMKNSDLNESDKVPFQNILLSILKDEKVSYEAIQGYTNLVFDDPKQILHKSSSILCNDLNDVHDSILELMKKGGLIPELKDPEISMDNINRSDATEDVDILISSNPTPDVDMTSFTDEDTLTDQYIETPDFVIKKEDKIKPNELHTFSLFDLTDTSPLKDENSKSDDKTDLNLIENPELETEEEISIELDLTKSNLVEVSIPKRIELPPLSREQKGYTAKNNMGEFKIQTFQDKAEWNGFFTFEVIKMGNGDKLDKMWLEVNGKKLYSEKNTGHEKEYLNYQLSNDLFKQSKAGEYEFNPYLWLNVPAKAYPGEYNSDISFTLIQ